MSYILDALKKADSERERGSVPGLHAQPVPLTNPRPDTPSGASTQQRMLTISGLSVALAGAAAWYWASPNQPAILPALVPAPQSDSQPATRPLMKSPQSLPPPMAKADSPPVSVAEAPTAASAKPVTAIPDSVVTQAQRPAVSTTPRETVAQKTPLTPLGPPLAATPAKAYGNALTSAQLKPRVESNPANSSRFIEDPIPAANELAPEIRAVLPKLVIGGATYSENAAYRTLIINGQVFQEREKPTPDLEVEQIRAKTVVLNFKGHRFWLAY